MTRTSTTFAEVTEAFATAYSQLCEADGENASSSFTWYAPTREKLAEDVGLGDSTADDILENAPDRIIGNVCSETIAWVYECNGNTLTEITATATMDALLAEFRLSMGFESI